MSLDSSPWTWTISFSSFLWLYSFSSASVRLISHCTFLCLCFVVISRIFEWTMDCLGRFMDMDVSSIIPVFVIKFLKRAGFVSLIFNFSFIIACVTTVNWGVVSALRLASEYLLKMALYVSVSRHFASYMYIFNKIYICIYTILNLRYHSLCFLYVMHVVCLVSYNEKSYIYIYTHITGNNSYNLASLNSSRSCILVGSKTCSAVNENAFCDLNLSNINAASIFLSCLIDSA